MPISSRYRDKGAIVYFSSSEGSIKWYLVEKQRQTECGASIHRPLAQERSSFKKNEWIAGKGETIARAGQENNKKRGDARDLQRGVNIPSR